MSAWYFKSKQNRRNFKKKGSKDIEQVVVLLSLFFLILLLLSNALYNFNTLVIYTPISILSKLHLADHLGKHVVTTAVMWSILLYCLCHGEPRLHRPTRDAQGQLSLCFHAQRAVQL